MLECLESFYWVYIRRIPKSKKSIIDDLLNNT